MKLDIKQTWMSRGCSVDDMLGEMPPCAWVRVFFQVAGACWPVTINT